MPMADGETGVLARPPFTLAPPPFARYTLVRDLGHVFPSRLDRLDARPGLRPDVPDALLRRMARRQRPQNPLPQSIATPRHSARAPLSFSSRSFLRPGHRQTHSQTADPRRNNPHHAPPRRRNLDRTNVV